MKTIRYNLNNAYDNGETRHPQLVIEELGMKILNYNGASTGDCIIVEVGNIPKRLPKFIELI